MSGINHFSWKRTILIASGIALASMMLFSDLCCGTQWVLYYNRAIEGRAVDADTGKPIGDALVIGMWQLSSYLSEGFDGYAKIIVEKTDARGKFSIPFWINVKPWKVGSRVHAIEPKVIIYKPGYKVHTSAQGKRRQFDAPVMSDEALKKAIEEHSINPAKLTRVYTDEEIWKNYLDFRFEASLSSDDYPSEQFTQTLHLIKRGLVLLPSENHGSRSEILNHTKQFED